MGEKTTIATEGLSEGWNLDNSYTTLPELFFTRQDPVPVPKPELVVFNDALAAYLGLDVEKVREPKGIEVFAGNRVPQNSLPIAQAYAGHQFGYFTMLGDGRAILLGEQITPEGKRRDIQLKGSGRTPYSRGGDGRAVLGPMLREYIISEAMHGLGIPTTRSLAVVTTGQGVVRESEKIGAVLTRVANSHLRVGTFQYAAARGNITDLKALADYVINRHHPQLAGEEERYLGLLKETIRLQAELIAKWQLVGFIHGVMNTDNMTLSGETIDYGPCAFMDRYDPATVFSSIDREGRYAYGNQPSIGAWNLARLAETLLPLLHEDQEEAIKLAELEIHRFSELFHSAWLSGMRSKLGLIQEETEDEALIQELLKLMQRHDADYTNTFLALTYSLRDPNQVGNWPELSSLLEADHFASWKERWQERRNRQEESQETVYERMIKSNPVVIPRNHQVEEALAAAEQRGDYRVMQQLLDVLANPYDHRADLTEFCRAAEPSDRPYRTYCGT